MSRISRYIRIIGPGFLLCLTHFQLLERQSSITFKSCLLCNSSFDLYPSHTFDLSQCTGTNRFGFVVYFFLYFFLPVYIYHLSSTATNTGFAPTMIYCSCGCNKGYCWGYNFISLFNSLYKPNEPLMQMLFKLNLKLYNIFYVQIF